MTDPFSEMAERVQLDMEAYALRQSIDGRRRVIVDALRAAHQRGYDAGSQLDEKSARIRELEARCHQLKSISSLLKHNGCDCDCDHCWEDHDDECERCLACLISEALQ